MPRKPESDKAANPIVVLHESQTGVAMTDHAEGIAIEAAYRLTMSPHEWEWSKKEVAAMARYCLWAHQRLSGIKQLAERLDLPRD